MGPKKWSQGYKKNSAVSWALYVVPLLRVLPTYFDAKDEFFFSFFESSQARGLIPSPTERYFQNWTALFEEALLSLWEVLKIHIFKLTKQKPVALKVSLKWEVNSNRNLPSQR